jgi:streptogramin lyase
VPPLWFSKITQVSVAPDGFVFVGDAGNHRVQVLTPQFEFHGVLGCGTEPNGVCANRDVVVLSSGRGFHVLRRSDGATSRQLQREEFYMGQLCFLPDGCHFATPTTHAPPHALFHVCGITVFSLDGEILQQIELMTWAHAIACTAAGELVVTDCYKQRLVVCSARAASLCKPLPRPTHACATSRSLASRCTAVRFTHATPTATGARC